MLPMEVPPAAAEELDEAADEAKVIGATEVTGFVEIDASELFLWLLPPLLEDPFSLVIFSSGLISPASTGEFHHVCRWGVVRLFSQLGNVSYD